jgi:ankyrin repeat protein
LSIVEYLSEQVESREELVQATCVKGKTALMAAAGNGHYAVVDCFTKMSKIDLEKLIMAKCVEGMTALCHAASNGHTRVCQLLIERVCPSRRRDLNMSQDSLGRTALMLAASQAHLSTVQLLVELEEGGHDLLFAKATRSIKGWTALSMASSCKKEEASEVVRYLAEKGGKPLQLVRTEKPHDGWTPMMIAARKNNLKSVECLADLGGKAVLMATNKASLALRFCMMT